MPPPLKRREHLNPRKLRKRLSEVDRQARANAVTTVYPVSKRESGSGTAVSNSGTAASVRFWIQIQAVGTGLLAGRYGWRTAVPTSGGGWSYTGAVGALTTDPAIEVNSVSTIPTGTFLEVERNATIGRILFQDDLCV